jgi:hypothetical protein
LGCDIFVCCVIKNDWCDIKSVKKLECFLFDIFERSKKNKERMTMSCQTSHWFLTFLYRDVY